MPTHKDIYGILELLAVRDHKSLSFEFSHQLRNDQKITSASSNELLIQNDFILGSYLVWNGDAYEFMYENIWQQYFDVT